MRKVAECPFRIKLGGDYAGRGLDRGIKYGNLCSFLGLNFISLQCE